MKPETRIESEVSNCLLHTLVACNRLLLHASEEASLLQQVCALLVNTGGFSRAWIGYSEREGATLRPVCHAVRQSLSGRTVCSSELNKLDQIPAKIAVRTCKPCVTRNHPRLLNEKAQKIKNHCSSRNNGACIGLPLLAGSSVLGVLMLHAGEAGDFSRRDCELLLNFAEDLGHVIQELRSRAQREQVTAELRRKNKDLQDFASAASHDLREPLRKISTFAERLRRQSANRLDDTGRDYLLRMETAARRLATLIERLLQHSRMATHAPCFEPVDLQRVMFGVLSDLETQIQRSRAHITFTGLPVLFADRLQLHALLLNLVGNALKFHAAGKAPEIHIEARKEDNWCELCVRDNGIGFDPKFAERIFLPFERLHSKQEYEGTGMGLAICRKIVEHHGGTIMARSQPGNGSEFVVRLPLRPPPRSNASPPRRAAELAPLPQAAMANG
jgi:signal transduction histidine kinase